MRPDDTPVAWRCEGCGKWSHAKRRPVTHRRFVKHDTDYGEYVEEKLCGPFARYVLALDDPSPPAPSPRIGEIVSKVEFEEDPNAGIEVPF